LGRIIFVIVVWYAALGGPAVARIDFATAAYGGQGIVEPEFEALPASGDASLVLENPEIKRRSSTKAFRCSLPEAIRKGERSRTRQTDCRRGSPSFKRQAQ
jgi:hypothetical protein